MRKGCPNNERLGKVKVRAKKKASVETLQLKLSELKNCSTDLVSYSGFFTINNKQNQKYRALFIPIQKTVFLKNSLIPAKMII